MNYDYVQSHKLYKHLIEIKMMELVQRIKNLLEKVLQNNRSVR